MYLWDQSKGRNQHKISINNYNMASWCKSFNYFVFDIKYLKKAVKDLNRNCYFTIADRVFQRIIGIPKGSEQRQDPTQIPINNYSNASGCKSSNYFVFDLKKPLSILIEIATLLLQITFFANLFPFYYKWEYINYISAKVDH